MKTPMLMVLCLQAGAVLAGDKLPNAKVTHTHNLEHHQMWQYETDLGVVHYYAGGKLWTLDMLNGGSAIGKPIPLPGLGFETDIIHLPKTGLLLVPETKAKRAPGRGVLINSLTGEVV